MRHILWCLLLNACCYIVVGCDWATASVLARTALLWPLLLPGWRPCTVIPVDFAQEVQDRFPQVSQLSGRFQRRCVLASGDPPQLRTRCACVLYL